MFKDVCRFTGRIGNIAVRQFASALAISWILVAVAFGQELSAKKPNFARVQVNGGDYSNPIDAINDSDSWCDKAMLTVNQSCVLRIRPGRFLLSEPLQLPAHFNVIGAGKSGTRRTQLVTAPGVETAILINTSSGQNTISDLAIKNTAGVQGTAYAILDEASHSLLEGPMITLKNLSIEVSGGTDNTGIEVGNGPMGNRPTLKNVDVTIVGGRFPRGIVSESAEAANVYVNVVGGTETEQTIGWANSSGFEGSSPVPAVVTDFHVSVRGGTEPLGMLVTAVAESVYVSDGQIEVSDTNSVSAGFGIQSNSLIEEGPIQFSSVEIKAATGILHQGGGLILTEVIVPDPATSVAAETALRLTAIVVNAPTVVDVRHSTLSGEVFGIVTENFDMEVTIVNSSISGGTNAILGHASSDIRIGSSRIIGPIDAGGGSIVCTFVYDEQFAPVTCP